MLDGHALVLQLCHARKNEKIPTKAGNDRSSTKLIVRNVAFEATEKDLRQLFSPFGQVSCYFILVEMLSLHSIVYGYCVINNIAKTAVLYMLPFLTPSPKPPITHFSWVDCDVNCYITKFKDICDIAGYYIHIHLRILSDFFELLVFLANVW